jgi:hypothetical protein
MLASVTAGQVSRSLENRPNWHVGMAFAKTRPDEASIKAFSFGILRCCQ